MGKRGQTLNCNGVAEVPDKRDDNGGLKKEERGARSIIENLKGCSRQLSDAIYKTHKQTNKQKTAEVEAMRRQSERFMMQISD